MSIGSAFDAYVKSYLHESLFGKGHKDSAKYELRTIFEAQVEPANRDWAWEAGKHVFDRYKQYGCVADLMLNLNASLGEPKFEMAVTGVVDGFREGVTKKRGGVPLLGKPDLYYINSEGAHVIHDWKVNGFCAKSAVSPMAGYINIRDCWSMMDGSPSRGSSMHKDCVPQRVFGMEINVGSYMEQYDESWATQLATYGWVMGEPVGKEIIVSVDQVACKPNSCGVYPLFRVAYHRSRVSEAYQFKALNDYQILWDLVNSEPFYFFRDMPYEDSKAKCDLLDMQATELYGVQADLTSDEQWLLDASRS